MDVNYLNILYDLLLYFSLSHYYFHVQVITVYKCLGNNGYGKLSGNLRVKRRSNSKMFILFLFKNFSDCILLEASLMIFEDCQINMFSLVYFRWQIRISMTQNVNLKNNILISCMITAPWYQNLLYNRIFPCNGWFLSLTSIGKWLFETRLQFLCVWKASLPSWLFERSCKV